MQKKVCRFLKEIATLFANFQREKRGHFSSIHKAKMFGSARIIVGILGYKNVNMMKKHEFTRSCKPFKWQKSTF